MVAKSISVWCAGAIVVGGMFLLGGQSSWASDGPAPAGQPAPIAAAQPAAVPTPAPVPANSQPQVSPVPANSQLQPYPAPINAQPQASPLQTQVCEDGGCADFCGEALCSPPGRFWFRADYLMWWTNGMKLPPLVTTSPQGTPVSEAGVLGLSSTTILYGNDTIGTDMRSGFRTTFGMWLDDCQTRSIEFDYFSLGQASNGYSATSAGDPILTRPFFNTETNAQASELVAYPDILTGTVGVETAQYFQSAGVLVGYNLCSCCSSCFETCDPCDPCDPCEESCGNACDPRGPLSIYGCRTDLLIGFRYYNLSDRVNITEDLLVTQQGPAEGTTFLIHDNFRARNDFYGSEIGLRTRKYSGRWSLEVMTKIAIGNNHQTITIDGNTTTTPPGGSATTYDTGIMAGSTNSGTYQRDTLTLIPQLSFELGYQINTHLRAYVGYNILYWGAVARAADQIDLNLDPRNFPPATAGGLPFPQFPGKTDAFWAQGLNVGTELRF